MASSRPRSRWAHPPTTAQMPVQQTYTAQPIMSYPQPIVHTNLLYQPANPHLAQAQCPLPQLLFAQSTVHTNPLYQPINPNLAQDQCPLSQPPSVQQIRPAHLQKLRSLPEF